MRSKFALVLGPFFVVLALAGLGCQVESRSPRRDGGLADTPVPPGTDAPIVPTDLGPRPDRGPLPAADTDADGLSDEDELARGTGVTDDDSDDDGQTDGVEVLAGTDPLNASSFIPGTDFYVVLPYGDEPIHRNLDFRARLGRADIFFLVDTTGSMLSAMENARSSLSTVIVPAVRDSIADVVMGVGDYQDFPVAPYGAAGDHAFLIRQTMTADISLVQAGLNALALGNGNDTPESGTQGLFVSVADPCPIPDGGFGAACFRTMSHPIIVVVTDAAMHNGPDPANNYAGVAGARTWTETVAALNANAVRIIGAAVTPFTPFPFPIPSGATADLNSLATATSSRNAGGMLTVYDAPSGVVSTAVVDGIVDLVGAVTQDVTSLKRDDESDTVDAREFITAITPVMASRPGVTFDATTFYDVPGGTTVTFDVTFQNDIVPPAFNVQIFRAYIDVYDLASSTTLDTRNVYIVVPPEDGILF